MGRTIAKPRIRSPPSPTPTERRGPRGRGRGGGLGHTDTPDRPSIGSPIGIPISDPPIDDPAPHEDYATSPATAALLGHAPQKPVARKLFTKTPQAGSENTRPPITLATTEETRAIERRRRLEKLRKDIKKLEEQDQELERKVKLKKQEHHHDGNHHHGQHHGQRDDHHQEPVKPQTQQHHNNHHDDNQHHHNEPHQPFVQQGGKRPLDDPFVDAPDAERPTKIPRTVDFHGPKEEPKQTKQAEPEKATGPHRLKFQLMSDIHMEQSAGKVDYKNLKIPVQAPYLLLAGDIGNVLLDGALYQDFLKRVCRDFTHVFLILGNNDCRGRDPDQIQKSYATAQSWVGRPGLERFTFLEKETCSIEDGHGGRVMILGTTLWSQLNSREQKLVASLPDFALIGGNTPQKHNERFQENIKWLKDTIRKVGVKDRKSTRFLIMTHHAPSRRGISRPGQDGGPSAPYYGTNLLKGHGPNRVTGLRPGDVWVFGHTHYTTSWEQDEIKVIANQKGGPNRPFNDKFTFEI